jgi:hypothetical protein
MYLFKEKEWSVGEENNTLIKTVFVALLHGLKGQ